MRKVIVISFEGVIASRNWTDGQVYYRSGITDGIRMIKMKTGLGVVILVREGMETAISKVITEEGMIDEVIVY